MTVFSGNCVLLDLECIKMLSLMMFAFLIIMQTVFLQSIRLLLICWKVSIFMAHKLVFLLVLSNIIVTRRMNLWAVHFQGKDM